MGMKRRGDSTSSRREGLRDDPDSCVKGRYDAAPVATCRPSSASSEPSRSCSDATVPEVTRSIIRLEAKHHEDSSSAGRRRPRPRNEKAAEREGRGDRPLKVVSLVQGHRCARAPRNTQSQPGRPARARPPSARTNPVTPIIVNAIYFFIFFLLLSFFVR